MKTTQANFASLASDEGLARTASGLKSRNFEPIIVLNKVEALKKIKELIPAKASVMNGSSETLREIGFVDYLKSGQHGWNNLHEAILAEKDSTKQKPLRDAALVADYYLGSTHALSESGEMVFGSNSGSQLPHLVFTSPNVILVVGSQKIVPTLGDALKRLEEYVTPLEDVRLMGQYGIHTMRAKTLILNRENPAMGRKITIIIVKEKLGF